MCGLTVGTSYNVQVTGTHFRVLEPISHLPIKEWTFQELKTFTAEKDSIVIIMNDSPGVTAAKFVFMTNKSREVLRALQHGIEQQIWTQVIEHRASLESEKKQTLTRPLPSPEEKGEKGMY